MMRASKFILFAAMLLPFALSASANANGTSLLRRAQPQTTFLPWRRKRLRPTSTATANSFRSS